MAVIMVQVLHVVRIGVQFGLRFFLAQIRLIRTHLDRVPNGLVEQQVVNGVRPLDFSFHLVRRSAISQGHFRCANLSFEA